jgi:hypothetical protein
MAVVRYREENGKISRKCGNTLIQTLRVTYGSAFAPGCADYAKLSDVLAKLDELSLAVSYATTRPESSIKSVSASLRPPGRAL